MKIKEKINKIIHTGKVLFLTYGLVFLLLWIACFFYSAVKLSIQNINYRGHSVGKIVKIERWMGWHDDAEAYHFTIISYRYQTEDGRIVTGKEDTNSEKTNEADRFVEEITELNPDIKVGAIQKLRYNLEDPQKVVSEYYRKNEEMFCLFTGVSSAAIVISILIVLRVIRRHST